MDIIIVTDIIIVKIILVQGSKSIVRKFEEFYFVSVWRWGDV